MNENYILKNIILIYNFFNISIRFWSFLFDRFLFDILLFKKKKKNLEEFKFENFTLFIRICIASFKLVD